jgi:hypothetical protein
MFRRTTFAVLAAATVALGGLAACSPITSYSGFQAIVSDPKDVKIGTDTKSHRARQAGLALGAVHVRPERLFYMNQIKQRSRSAGPW